MIERINSIIPIMLFTQLTAILLLIFLQHLPRKLSELTTTRVTLTTTLVSLFSAILLAILLIQIPSHRHVIDLGSCFKIDHYKFEMLFVVDILSVSYAFFTSILLSIIAVFSKKYLHRERGFHRFYTLILLFIFGVNLISFAGTIEIVIAGWEFVGLSSILLISFFNYRSAPVKNAFYVFVNYRICDIGLCIAALLMHSAAHSSSFEALTSANWYGISDSHVSIFLGFCLLFAAMGKSALFPFSSWLPRAMEGPTPSSAIFYGAISVHLGPLLLLRSADLIAASPILAAAIIVVGLTSSYLALIVGHAQSDIKSMLAYASITQLGLIVAEIGFGFNTLALLHTIGHSGFRTLQILRAPSLLHDIQHLESMLGHHVKSPLEAKNKIFSYAYYRFILERGFLDLFFKSVLARIFSVFSWIDKLEQNLKAKKIAVICAATFLSAVIFVPQNQTIISAVFLFFLIGLFPFQSWYLKLFSSSSFGLIAVFVTCQTALIWALEFLFGLETNLTMHWFLTAASMTASMLAFVQDNPRRTLAYLISSQLAFFSFAHSSTSTAMNFGSIYMLIGIIGASTGFILMIGLLEARRGNLSLARPSGSYESYPKLAYYLLIFGLISSGLPFSIGYVAEDLIFESSFEIEPMIDILWLLCVAINNITIVKMFLFLCHGLPRKEKGFGQLDLKSGKIFAAAALTAILFLITVISGFLVI